MPAETKSLNPPTSASPEACPPESSSLARRVVATLGILGLVVVLVVVFARRRELT